MNWMRAFVAVFWSFLGIRKGSEYDKDVRQITVGQVIVAGLVSAMVLVLGLVALVVYLTRHS